MYLFSNSAVFITREKTRERERDGRTEVAIVHDFPSSFARFLYRRIELC